MKSTARYLAALALSFSGAAFAEAVASLDEQLRRRTTALSHAYCAG